MEEFINTLQDFMVLVRCFTYKHSAYITDALNGFTMQQTTFPFVIVVVDDASNDGEQKVIQDYVKLHFERPEYETESDNAHIIFAQHGINKNCYITVYYLKENHYCQKRIKTPYIQPWRDKCKYEAICEGDDYWIDPLKLQHQVDFLEENMDYSFVCHRYNIYNQNAGIYLKEYAFDYYKEGENLEITLDLYSKTWVTQTLTTIIRTEAYKRVCHTLSKYSYSRDVHLYYHLLKEGKGISLNRNMGVYRWHDGGVASTLSGCERYSLAYNVFKEMYEFNKDDKIIKRIFLKNLIYYLRYAEDFSCKFHLFSEGLLLSDSLKDKYKLINSLLLPTFIYSKLAVIYRWFYLNNIKVKNS